MTLMLNFFFLESFTPFEGDWWVKTPEIFFFTYFLLKYDKYLKTEQMSIKRASSPSAFIQYLK